MRIAKNNLAYPLLKDTFMLLGSSKCEVLSLLDLKDVFHSLRLTETPGNTVEYSHFWQRVIPVSKNAYWTQYFPCSVAIIHKCHIKLSIWQEIL